MASIRRSLFINFFASTGDTMVQFAVSLFLARLLSPSDIGVYSMTIVFVNIAHIFQGFGVGSYLQREKDLTPEKLRAATGVLFTTSWLIAAAMYAGSDWFGRWFNEPQMIPVMKVLAICFAFIPFGAITHSLLTREFAAGKQAWVTAVSTAASAVTCVSLAVMGFGTMSMAWGNLANIIACCLAYIPLRPKYLPWLPSFRHWREVVHFGLSSLLTNCLDSVNNSLPDILLGKLGNARLVGLFSRANSTVTIFFHIAGSTANYGSVSYIAQAHHRGEPVGALLSRATALLLGIAWPALALTYIFATEIITVLYGEKWLPSVPAMDGLLVSCAIGTIFNYYPAAMTAIGRPYLAALPTAVTLLSRIAFALALFDGSIRSFSWVICAATLVATPVVIIQQRIYFHYRFGAMLVALWPSAAVAIMCMAGAALLKVVLPASVPPAAVLLLSALPLACLWYLSLRLMGHPLTAEIHKLASGFQSRFASS
ncbi:oligosaccharide flippase family protein [Noviherbaspirillum suwonense]|uniref:Membrane protein involved in the export of O-antigen and teichoic acid n=1 Tax=Noviherbaspirillum suwonense TaxID=1224511 RepID=A0ABY1QED6_9BURK|nr:oligosaccharide flippase family protein [Noviherbaspirillum suwonense]SMP67096.1 Membrane protein involved in the export of O-antigen and teichoic acid [Noviherbaspirillum suwonense]